MLIYTLNMFWTHILKTIRVQSYILILYIKYVLDPYRNLFYTTVK